MLIRLLVIILCFGRLIVVACDKGYTQGNFRFIYHMASICKNSYDDKDKGFLPSRSNPILILCPKINLMETM